MANEQSPEQDAAIAHEALRRGELQHAAFHIGCALASDPTRRDWLDLLDQIIRQAGPEPEWVAPLDPKQTYFATAAVRAYILAQTGRLDDAVPILLSVMHARPEAPYFPWLLAWKDRPGFAAAFGMRAVIGAVLDVVARTPDMRDAPDADRSALTRMVPLLALATEVHPEEEMLWWVRSVGLRKLGQIDDALRVAQEGHRRKPTYMTAVAMAAVYRVQGQIDAAIAANQEALRFKPEDAAVRNDIADMLIDRGDLEQGVGWYRAVLDREPEQEWALPSALYYMDLLHPGAGWLARLRAFGAEHPRNERALRLMARAEMRESAYVSVIPPSGEACINVARHLVNKLAENEITPGSTVGLQLSHLESPSARLAIDMAFARNPPAIRVDYSVATVPTPDTRSPLVPVEYLLWTYREMTPVPNVPPPPLAMAQALAALASEPFRLDAWRNRARGLAAQFGPQSLHGLLGAMVHPPAAPADAATWDWIRQVQLACALTIAQLDGPWAGSPRRSALYSLVYGPMDWTGEMALAVLADLAVHVPALQAEVYAAFTDLLRRRPSEGAWQLEMPLLLALSRWPGLDEHTRSGYLQRVDAVLS